MSHPDAPTLAPPVTMEPLRRLRRDMQAAITQLSPTEARYLVDLYYEIQLFRTSSGNQKRALTASGEPAEGLAWVHELMDVAESDIKKALDWWTDQQHMGRYAKSIFGIGPVISAGLLAHIDITRARTVGHIWRFAGLDPTLVWAKGEKRPYNAKLKVLCWKAGNSFVKFHNDPRCYYGHLYAKRKQYELDRDARGDNADEAKRTLATRNFDRDTDAKAAYLTGHLPPGRLDLRARRWAVKLFLAHWHAEAYRAHYGSEPPLPYPIAVLDHVDFIGPPDDATGDR